MGVWEDTMTNKKHMQLNKEVNEHLPKLSEVPRGKLKQKMSSSGKLVKCEKKETIQTGVI